MQEPETKDFLLKLAEEHGYTVSARQLARWHRLGLLPKPCQKSLGRFKGTQSIYPPSTGKQLLVLCALKKMERRVAFLGWHLWWEGYEIPMHLVRGVLGKSVEEYRAVVSRFVDKQKGGLTEEAWAYIDASPKARPSISTLSKARRRTGRKDFETPARIAFEIAAGQFERFYEDPKNKTTDQEEEIFRKTLAFDLKFEIEKESIEPMLRRTSVANRKWTSRTLSEYYDEDLNKARNELLELRTKLPSRFADFLIPTNVPKNRTHQCLLLWHRLSTKNEIENLAPRMTNDRSNR